MLRTASRFFPGPGYANSSSSNREETDPLSEKLSNLVFNLGVFAGAQHAQAITDQLCGKLTNQGLKIAENKLVIGSIIDVTADIIASQIGVDISAIKYGLKETIGPTLKETIAVGRTSRAKQVWTWTKKALSPLKGVARPFFNAVGEVRARDQEEAGELENLANQIRTSMAETEKNKQWVEEYDYLAKETNRSINPFNVGICKAIANIFLNCMIALGLCEEPKVWKKAERAWDTQYFETEVNKALMQKTDNRLDLTVIAKELGLKSLTSERFHTWLHAPTDVTIKVTKGVQDDIKNGGFGKIAEDRELW